MFCPPNPESRMESRKNPELEEILEIRTAISFLKEPGITPHTRRSIQGRVVSHIRELSENGASEAAKKLLALYQKYAGKSGNYLSREY